ncbi:MAG: hypothetical protein PHW24_01785 [Candidatus Moranbacteria bacterium]|nr:hypothetical protein [Candidatus Moranbacteria bacterium]
MKESMMPSPENMGIIIKDNMSKEQVSDSYKRGIKYDKGFKQGVAEGYAGNFEQVSCNEEKSEDEINFEAGRKNGIEKGVRMAENN